MSDICNQRITLTIQKKQYAAQSGNSGKLQLNFKFNLRLPRKFLSPSILAYSKCRMRHLQNSCHSQPVCPSGQPSIELITVIG